MFVKQNRDTFVRRFGELGYITSQLTKRDRVYDEAGAVFLSALSRTPRSIEDMIDGLHARFVDVSRDGLGADVREFISDLEAESFLATGNTPLEAERKDVGFTYRTQHPKTAAVRFLDQDEHSPGPRTDDVLTAYFREHPTIFGIHFEVTSRCNERCIHCYQPRGPTRTRDMDLEFAARVMEQLAAMGTASVTFSGGEPAVHRGFPDILRLARDSDFMINILTNGQRMDAELLDAIRDVGVNMVQVSLYSMEPEVHDDITGVPGSHGRTLATIERMLERDIPVQISCPLMKRNRHSYKGVSAWCSECKVRVLSDFIMLAMTDFDTSNLANRLSLEETREAITDILEVDDEYQVLLDQPPKTADLDHFADQPVCGVGIDNACIAADGSIYPCAGFRGFVLGNARDKPIKQIWEESEGARFLRSITNRSFPKCLKCEARDFCVMCLVRNYNESGGDMFQVAEHFCRVAFLNKDLVDEFRRRNA